MRFVGRQTGQQQQQSMPRPHQQLSMVPQQAMPDLSGVLARLAEAEKNIGQLVTANNALVTENAKLKQAVGTALANYRSHFNGLVRQLKVAYTPDPVQAPQPTRTNAPTRPMSPSAQVIDAVATPGAPPAGPPQTAAQQMADNANKLFYGEGEAAFYQGGEDEG